MLVLIYYYTKAGGGGESSVLALGCSKSTAGYRSISPKDGQKLMSSFALEAMYCFVNPKGKRLIEKSSGQAAGKVDGLKAGS